MRTPVKSPTKSSTESVTESVTEESAEATASERAVEPTPGPTPGPAPEPKGGQAPRRGPSQRTWRRVIAVLGVLAVGLAAAVGIATWQDRDEGGLTEQHQAVARAAEAETVAFLTVDYRDMESAIDKVLAGATGDFKKDYGSRRKDIVEAATRNESVSTGKVVSLGIGEMDEDSALVYVAANSEVSNTTTEGTKQPRYYRLQLDMTLEDGKWLASQVQFVG